MESSSCRTIALVATAAAFAAASPARAQHTVKPAPRPAPQVAGIAPSPSSSRRDGDDGEGRRPDRRDRDDRDGHGRDGRGFDGRGGRWVYGVVGGDGRVYANLGYGWEPVVGACGSAYATGYAQSASAPPAYAPPAYSPPTYTPPVYNPPAYTPPSYGAVGNATQPVPDPSAQPVPRMAPAPGSGATAAQYGAAGASPAPYGASQQPPRRVASCWTTDAQGRVLVLSQ